MARGAYSEEQIERALDALSDPQRFREAESLLAARAPQLQRVLGHVLEAGGWFGESHHEQVLRSATIPDSDERLSAIRTLLAEETRMGMMIGVAVGWALSEELGTESEETEE